jgi:hypothetical protein
MISLKRLFPFAIALVALAYVAAPARAQQATPSPAPEMTTSPSTAPEATAAPAATQQPTLMDREYDGHLHVLVAPYVWLPTVKGNFQYSIPTLPTRPRGVVQSSFSVAPAEYAGKLNSAAMFAFDARQGGFDVFGDYIYTNASASASAFATISGRFGKIAIPVSLSTNAHLAMSIWEAAAGFTVARGHDADLSAFMGIRETPLNPTFDYTVIVGKRGIFMPSSTIMSSAITQDVIFGLRGKAFFGDGRWFVPYYVDVGTGAGQISNQTWEAYTGAGYAFNHGQTILAAWRSLNYDSFAPISHVQKLTLSGPLLGYTFNI